MLTKSFHAASPAARGFGFPKLRMMSSAPEGEDTVVTGMQKKITDCERSPRPFQNHETVHKFHSISATSLWMHRSSGQERNIV